MDTQLDLKAGSLNPESKYATCPYNSSHRILRARMQYHLVKCKRNVKEKPEEEKSICPFDATHHVKKEEYEEHIKTCPNRRIVDSEKYAVESEDTLNEPAAAYTLPELPPSEENWDDENQHPYTYDPTPHLENQPILRTMHGATKSERRAFRQVERIKMIQFQSGQPMDTAAAANAAGVAIVGGKYLPCGRGQTRLPLGHVTPNEPGKINLNNLGEKKEGHLIPVPVEGGRLRPARAVPMAVKLANISAPASDGKTTDRENRAPSPSTGAIRKVKQPEESENIPNGMCRPLVNGNAVRNGSGEPKSNGENDCNRGQPSYKKPSQTLEEYKESVRESRLAAKLGLLANSSTESSKEERAHDFTYLDEEWQVLTRRGRRNRGGGASNGEVAKVGRGAPSGRKW